MDLAGITLLMLLFSVLCFCIIGFTPRNTSLYIDGTFLVLGIVFGILGVIGMLVCFFRALF